MSDTVPAVTGLETASAIQMERKHEALDIFTSTGQQQTNGGGLTFTQGLVMGQLSVLIVLFTFIRFFIFQTGTSGSGGHESDTSGRNKRLNKKQSSILRPTAPTPSRTILAKTYYNVETHPAESLDWLNVLVAQSVAQLREDARSDNNILHSLDRILNGDSLPKFLDTVHVTELDIGDEFPIFSNCKIYPCEDDPGRLEARFDVDLADSITLGIDTKVLLNYPKPWLAVLPVSLSVSIVRFSGRLTVSFKRQPAGASNSENKNSLAFSFSPDYRLEFSTRSLVGSRSRLQNLPKISQLVESRIQKWFVDRCVQPRFQEIILPSLWPRSKNTREAVRL
ncbi:hypothetical protein V1511DRAFT_510673 [Dipodascopsis uninucleata]